MANIATDVDAKVSSDSTGSGIARLGCSQELTTLGGCIVTLPNHRENWGGLHELNKTTEERLLLEVGIMGFEVGLRWLDKLHSDKLEAFLLESRNDGSAKVALDTIGLDHDEGSLFVA